MKPFYNKLILPTLAILLSANAASAGTVKITVDNGNHKPTHKFYLALDGAQFDPPPFSNENGTHIVEVPNKKYKRIEVKRSPGPLYNVCTIEEDATSPPINPVDLKNKELSLVFKYYDVIPGNPFKHPGYRCYKAGS